jgi:SpoVK/Ycf46/Vps4 family AAA+-type ATPase
MAAKKNKNFLFRNIKLYGSTEWLANNQKKYRTVYDVSDVQYIYCELSLFNLQFSREDWELDLQLKCINEEGEEMCNLDLGRQVSKAKNIIYIREGWGTQAMGGFWKIGIYKWQAFSDGKMLGEKAFYIQNYGPVSSLGRPYFEIYSSKLYEGPDANVLEKKRKYLTTFNKEYTRYVWIEINAKNLLLKDKFWTAEFIFNFRTENLLLKGSVAKVFHVYKEDDEITVTLGWGADVVGTWAKGTYSVDVLFMDKIILNKEFIIGDDYVAATEDDFASKEPVAQIEKTADAPKKTSTEEKVVLDPEEIASELNDLIGLQSIKDKIKEYTNYLEFISLRKDKGIKENEPINLHAVFKGNPGTGKTTVSRKLGKIYKKLGLLSKGHVHEVDRTDLVAEFIGQTAPKTKAAIKKAKGGILFIDEAYSLARKNDDAKDFGKEAIEILIKAMTDESDMAVIVAGYPEEMQHFLESNPGLKSRFNMHFDFPDYLPQELMEIAEASAHRKGINFEEGAQELFYKKVVDAYRGRDKFFGNARLINSLVDECKMNLGLRIMLDASPATLTINQISTITTEDVDKLSLERKSPSADIPIDEELLKESLEKLQIMIGLDKVKASVNDLIKLVRFYKETGKDVRQSFSLHSVFTGNPGTGKTTVARIISLIYKSLGILERGHLIECDRQSLVGGYIGQTALKTGEVIDKAMGGVLFIDEAYSLTEGGNSDYGKEAIEIILKRMEDYRGDFIVIAAGYTGNMKQFLESNPGLKSRFDRAFHFEDFDSAELTKIALNQFQEAHLNLSAGAKKALGVTMDRLYNERDKYFGNGRSVRKIVEQVIRAQHLRMSEVAFTERTTKMIHTLKQDDFDAVVWDDKDHNKKGGIGFKVSH